MVPEPAALAASHRLIDGFLDALWLERGARPNTRAGYGSDLRQFYQWRLREDGSAMDPTVSLKAPRLGRRLPRSLSEDEIVRLLEAPETYTPLGLRKFGTR